MVDRVPSLADEVRQLHACLFNAPPDAIVVERYEAAHRLSEQDEAGAASVVFARRLDAEAVEFALRRRGLGRELARKMQIVCYLVEVRPEYFDEFVNTESSRRRAWAAVIGATLRSAWKLLKGEYLIRRHGLV